MALLSAEQLEVRFGGVHALFEVSLDVEAARVTGLIGPNGAGKTTCFNVITGLQRATIGRVSLGGVDVTRKTPSKRARMGVARTFQRLEAFSSLSARDNVLVAAEQRKAWDKSRFDPGAVADELLERVGLASVARYIVGTLPTGTARLVELARALATKPRVLLLDEPSSGLNEQETDEIARLLRRLVSEGLAVLLVVHDMSFVMDTCEVIYVLDFGKIISSGTPGQVQSDPAVKAAYLGSAGPVP
jgi:branched-chain amino acid transport system ATP-binding protein